MASVVVGILVPALEALFWCVAFIECAALMVTRAGLGAMLGAIVYGVVYHHALDARTILAATWLAAVINISYLLFRRQSRAKALVWVVGLRWVFAGFALLAFRDVI